MEEEISGLDVRDSLYHCLVNAAHQFRVQKDGEAYLLAGYPWFKCRARDTFISLPGLTLSVGETAQFEKYMETASKAIRNYINKEPVSVAIYEMEQPDTLLWAIWCIQQYGKYVSRHECHKNTAHCSKKSSVSYGAGNTTTSSCTKTVFFTATGATVPSLG